MMDTTPLHCKRCLQQYDRVNRIPLILECGHSSCMVCIVTESYAPTQRLVCSCGNTQIVTMMNVKSMTTNQDLLDIIAPKEGPRHSFGETPPHRTAEWDSFPPNMYPLSFTPGPSSRSLFDSPPVQRPPLTPPHVSYRMSSVNSIAMKCKRLGCNNDRLYLAGKVYEFCCVDCYNRENKVT